MTVNLKDLVMLYSEDRQQEIDQALNLIEKYNLLIYEEKKAIEKLQKKIEEIQSEESMGY